MDARTAEILAKIASGELTAARGAALLEIERKRARREAEDARAVPPGRAHWIKVRIRTSEGIRFSIPIPLSLVGLGLRIASRYVPEGSSFDPAMVREAIRLASAQKAGKIVEIHDDEADVEIWLY
ncbi:MAG: hypothetical protein ACM3XN_11565 [Chloroflexota bacterium]